MPDETLNQPKTRMEKVNATLKPLLREKYSLWILGAISFVESALPIPLITDPFMVAYIIAHRSRVIIGVAVTTLASMLGGLAAYLVAAFFTETLLSLASPGTLIQFTELSTKYSNSSLALGFLGAITPVPFTLAAVVAGAMKGSALLFLLGALIGRIIRYSITGYLTYRFGREALAMAEKNIWPITFITCIIVALYLWFIM